MKNSKGISLIALIITIIVIIILAAIVIGGVFNTPNDAKFANFCQEYDRVQTAIQLRYYELYQKYTLKNTTKVPTHFDIYNEIATGTEIDTTDDSYSPIDADGWVRIVDAGWAKLCDKPNGLVSADSVTDGNGNIWYLRLNDGKLVYSGFEKEEADMYYTPNVHAVDSSTDHNRAKIVLSDSSSVNSAIELNKTATINPSDAFTAGTATAKPGVLGLAYSGS